MRDDTMTRAGFGPRLAAFVIDRALLFAALMLVRLPAWIAALAGAGAITAKTFLFDHSALDVLCYLLSAAYFVVFTCLSGGTLGKKLMRLRVVNADGGPLGFVDVLYRETVGRFLSGVAYLGYLMAIVDKDKRAFHDWLCHTAVVYDDGLFPPRPAKKAPAPVVTGGYSVPGMCPAPEDEKQPADDRAETSAEEEK